MYIYIYAICKRLIKSVINANLSTTSIRILPAQPSIFPTWQTRDPNHPLDGVALFPLGLFSGVDDFFSLVVSDFMLLEPVVGLGLGLGVASVFEACFVVAGFFIEVLMGSGLGFCDFSGALGSWGFAFRDDIYQKRELRDLSQDLPFRLCLTLSLPHSSTHSSVFLASVAAAFASSSLL